MSTIVPKLGKAFLDSLFSKTKSVAQKVNDLIDAVSSGSTSQDTISPKTSGGNITFTAALVRGTSSAAINSTGTATAAQIATGLITSTSAAATAITLPTATQLATALGVTAAGEFFDFTVDNSAGANTVTVVVGTGIVVATPAITGGATLTVSTANAIAVFRVYFKSTSTAVISRLI